MFQSVSQANGELTLSNLRDSPGSTNERLQILCPDGENVSSGIQELLHGKSDVLDHEAVLSQYSWLMEDRTDCILSPDSDGFLSGLLMSHIFNWKIRGFYDGKVLVVRRGIDVSKCVFLDIEIFRNGVRSIGHHMLLYNRNIAHENWINWNTCLQPNILRNYDALHSFRIKYPLATVHLLLATVGVQTKVRLPGSSICPLLFTDGTFNVLFKYPENVLDWLRYLGAEQIDNPLNTLFMSKDNTVYSLMVAMDTFFKQRDTFSAARERGDRLRISQRDGTFANLITESSRTSIKDEARKRAEGFITLLGQLTGWTYNEKNWDWTDLVTKKFTKKITKTLNGTAFNKIILDNPLSWAITAQKQMEYTIELTDKLLDRMID